MTALTAHSAPPVSLSPLDLRPITDFLKTTLQMERYTACRDERRHYGAETAKLREFLPPDSLGQVQRESAV